MSVHADHCTFCDLIRGSAEVSICHEDADALAFMDIQPVNAGHVLVVPRQHYENLLDVPQELGLHLFQVTMRLANAVSRVSGCTDMNIVVNSGAAAGQDEPHYHVHIIPRRHGDGFDIPLPFNGSQMPDRTMLDAIAARIIAAMRDPMRVGGTGSKGGNERASEQRVSGQASDGDTPEPTTARSSEQPLDVPVFSEAALPPVSPVHGSGTAEPSRSGAYEGAHGELRYTEPSENDG